MGSKEETVRDLMARLRQRHEDLLQVIRRYETQSKESGESVKDLLESLTALQERAIDLITRFETQNRDAPGALEDLLHELKKEGTSAIEEIGDVNIDRLVGLARPDRDVGH